MIPIDFETYSEAGFVWDDAARKWRGPPGAPGTKRGLPVVGIANYARHPSTEVLCLAYGGDLWTPDMPPPVSLFAHLRAGGLVSAWNASFEWWIWNEVCARRFGWPPLPLQQIQCTMARARAHALPGALANAGTALNLAEQKDADGARLLKKFAMPRNPTKADPRPDITPAEDPEDAARLYEYCRRDVRVEQAIAAQIPPLSPLELHIWQTDQAINARGVQVDVPAVGACAAVVDQCVDRYGSELEALAGCKPTELQQLKGWLAAKGVHLGTMDEDAIDVALDGPLPADARRALELRQLVGSASVKKVYAMRNAATAEGRLHGLYTYHGARTGRPTGEGPQPTNLPKAGPHVHRCGWLRGKPTARGGCGRHHGGRIYTCPWCGITRGPDDPAEWSPGAAEDALEIIGRRSAGELERYFGDAMLTVAGCLRGLFIAKPGHTLISSDFTAIEGVVIAALAAEQWRLEVFAGHGRIYEMSASQAFGVPYEHFERHRVEHGSHHPLRQKGKGLELACGYGGWLGAVRQFGVEGDDDALKRDILAWRDASPSLVHFWGGQRRNWRTEYYGLEGAAVQAVLGPGTVFPVTRLDGSLTGISYECRNDVLYCTVPSGGVITYHRPRLTQSAKAWRGLELSFEGWNSNPKQGAMGWVRMNTYSGKLAENCTQRVARDIQMHAIENCERAGYPAVMHTYDEIVAEVPEGFGSVEEIERLMCDTPEWARGWPIKAAGGWRAKRYRKG